jgi:hypothetical protein
MPRRVVIVPIIVTVAILVLINVSALVRDPARASAASPIQTVFVVVFENHNWSDIVNNSAAPYINQLLSQASHAENYRNPPGVHPSAPNYLWLEGGQDFGLIGGSTFTPAVYGQSTSQHLVTQLKNAGISWKAYQESMPPGQCPLTDASPYAVRHDPFVFFNDVTDNQSLNSPYCLAHVRPYTDLAADLTQGTTGRYNFITPNVCHDMHDCGIGAGDTWLSSELPKILQSSVYQQGGAVFIVWDEGAGSTSDGPIGLIALSPAAKGHGYSSAVPYTHSSLLLTLQEIFGVRPLLGDAVNATDLSDLFAAFPAVAPSSPAPGDGAAGINTNVMLKWSSSGSNDSVYLGTSNPPGLLASGVSTHSITPPGLSSGVTYFWQVASSNSSGTTRGPVWTFTTQGDTVVSPYNGTPAPVPGQINAENFDNGGEGIAYHDATSGNTGGQYRTTDVDIERSSEGGYDVGWIGAGEWANYTVSVTTAGSYTVQLRVSSPAGASMHLGFNTSSNVWKVVSIPATGGWQNWTTITVPVTLGAGTQQMTLLFDTGGMNYRSAAISATSSGNSQLAGYAGVAASVPGTIEAENFDNGGEGIAYHDTTAENAGGQYRQTDVDIEPSSEGGYDVGWIASGEWLNYTVNVATAGTYTVELRVASLSGGAMHVGFNTASNVWKVVSVPATGGWQNWTTVTVPVTLGAGTQQITILADVGGFNIDFMTIR